MNNSFLRKIAAISAASVAFMVTLCGCGAPSQNESNLPELVIGVDYYEPSVYRTDDGDFAGLDIELAEEVSRHLGLKPKFVHIDWSKKKTYLESGEIDCIWCCFTMTGREDDYSWTVPYMNSRQVVAVPENSKINSISDLNGKRVAVQSTTKPDDIFSGRAGVKMVVPELKALNCFPNTGYMFAAINEGYVDAIAGHELVLRSYMQTSSANLRILNEPLLEVQVGVAFLKGTNAEMIKNIDKTFKMLKNNGYLSNLFISYGLDPELYAVNYEQTR